MYQDKQFPKPMDHIMSKRKDKKRKKKERKKTVFLHEVGTK